MELPHELRETLENEIGNMPVSGLAFSATELSGRYRTGQPPTGSGFFHSREDFAAYAAFRMPATFAAVLASLEHAKDRLQGWQPLSLSDIGAGPGTASWAATHVFPNLERITMVEREEGMVGLGKRLAASAPNGALKDAQWIKADMMESLDLEPMDLVIASYSLNEIPEGKALGIVDGLWRMTGGLLLIVEPGTPVGFARIRLYRDMLLRLGGSPVAPCPHSSVCPIEGDDWCHFSQRVPRSRLHRMVKSGDLGYEDEKYSYIAVSRAPVSPPKGRILKKPRVTKGYVAYEACTPEGIARFNTLRREKEAYKAAKDLDWGSALES